MYKVIVFLILLCATSLGQISIYPKAESANLYGYAYKDSVNEFTASQNFDSINVTDEAAIDTLRTNVIIAKDNSAMYIMSNATKNIFVGRADLTSYMSIRGTDASHTIYFQVQNTSTGTMSTTGFEFGDGTTGRPKVRSSAPALATVSYGFVGDENTGLLWNSADNFSLVTNSLARATYSTTSVSFFLPIMPASMDETARDALSPSAGWIIWNTTAGKLQVFNGITWDNLH